MSSAPAGAQSARERARTARVEALLAQAERAVSAGRPARALGPLRRAIAADPSDARAPLRLAELLLAKLRGVGGLEFTTVLAPAMGGLVIGQEVARQAGARYIFAEKENDRLVLRRGFKFAPGERVLIVEDVVTRGGRVLESIDIVRKGGGVPVAVAMLVDRSAGTMRFDIPAVSLLELSFPTFEADKLPPELAALPVEKPGS